MSTAGTAAGVAAIALKPEALTTYKAKAPADLTLAKPAWEFCNRTWATDARRVAQSNQDFLSTTGQDLLGNTVIAYDSAEAASQALSDFRSAGASCPAYDGTVLGNKVKATVAQAPTELPASAQQGFGTGVASFLIARQVRVDKKSAFVVDVFLQRGPYVVDCVGSALDGSRATDRAGRCAAIAAKALNER